LYEIYSIVLTEENKAMVTNSISSCKFKISRRGIFFAKAGEVAFEMLSDRRTGTEQSYRIETRIK
jgi:hypothetical protein